MFKLNKVDIEILMILNRIFLNRKVNPILSDDNMRLWIIRSLFVVSLLCLITRVFMGFSEQEVTAELSAFFNIQIAMFFGMLFLHINNESENTSAIVFLLT